jgi:hypothetical protein
LIKELQSLALDVKVLTENREEIEIKIQDDDMSETAKEIGLLVGDEDPRLAQTVVAQREAEQVRIAALAAAAVAGDGVAIAEEEDDEEIEASDEEVAAASASPRSVIVSAPEIDETALGALGEDLAEPDVVEEPAHEDETPDEGYQLEDEELEPEEEAEEEEASPLAVEEEF